MKNLSIIISILLFCNLITAQIAVIKDIDGFTNVRKAPNSSSEVIYKLYDSEVFTYEESTQDWIPVFISKNKYSLDCSGNDKVSGYIHKSRLLPLENIKPYGGTDFSFRYELKEFTLNDKMADFDGKWLTHINGRDFYGTDGNIPSVEVAGIKATLKGETIEIPNFFYEDIFECTNEFQVRKNKDDFIVYQWNSDGAGGYLIVWVIGDKKLKQRLIFMP